VADWPHHPPIGRAISNTKILILNDDMQLVPIGVPGEIYISGLSLAKGYINNMDLTEERFIEDPWEDNQEMKLYRTGDYGKYLPDGNIVFIGRKDHQVKIRGFRIELQEIDSNLTKFPGIQEAAVIAKNNATGDKYLEAFLVTNINEHQDDLFDRIIMFLKDKLPSHMIPSYIHVIEKMPLTSSGKVDRRALENYEKTCIKHSRHFSYIVHATTPTEKTLVKIMEDFFKIHVGINYSFTSIGGNSLLAMQIVAKIRDEFSVEIPAFSVLSDASIAHTAKRIDNLLTKS
jgi:acyl-coenzyme A synthetase/AMP-(fatty) acid ligase/acyl carrier protein